MKSLKVTYAAGMVNIDSDDITFGWIPNMYEGNRNGIMFQANSHLNREKAKHMCLKIAEAVAEFNKHKE